MAASSFQVDISDEDLYAKEIQQGAAGVLQVVEVYQGFCGPSKAVVSSFKRFTTENPDAPVKFYTANASKIPALAKYGTCEPIFVFCKEGKVVEEVTGMQLPRIQRLIAQLSSGGGAAIAQRASSED